MGPLPCYSQSEVVYVYQVFDLAKISSLKNFFVFNLFHHHGNHFPEFFCHNLSWGKTYDPVKFLRNQSMGLTGMMV